MRRSDAVASLSRFGLVGIAAMLCHGVSLWAWVELFGVGPVWSNTVAFMTAFGFSYYGHYYWTFKSETRHRDSMGKFFAVAASGFLLNVFIMYLATTVYGLNYWWGFMLIVLSIPTMTYLVSSSWVFVSKD